VGKESHHPSSPREAAWEGRDQGKKEKRLHLLLPVRSIFSSDGSFRGGGGGERKGGEEITLYLFTSQPITTSSKGEKGEGVSGGGEKKERRG